MQNNNIPDNPLSYRDNYIINSEYKLLINADINNEKVHILVEGNKDEALLCHIISDNIDIIVCEGKENVLKKLECDCEINCIGILDRDYEYNYNNSKIFLYDYCCLEMMIISDKEIIKKIAKEFKVKVEEILDIIYNLLFISLIRKYNHYHKLGIDFDPLRDVSKYYDRNINKIDNHKMIELLKKQKKGDNKKIIEQYNYEKLISKIGKIQNFDKDKLLNITNGHDFLNIFINLAKNSEREFWLFTRGAYNKDIFEKTKLYKKLLEYQNKNNLKIF